MLLEGRSQIARIPKLEIANYEGRPRNRKSFAYDAVEMKSHPYTETAFKLVVNLFGNNQAERATILVNLLNPLEADSRKVPVDYIDFYDPIYNPGIRLYCNADGFLSFAVINNEGKTRVSLGFRPKIESARSQFDDAKITSETIKRFIQDMGVKDIAVNGPKEKEEYVVVTRENGEEAIALSGDTEIMGFVFAPNIGRDIHGDVSLITRKKRV